MNDNLYTNISGSYIDCLGSSSYIDSLSTSVHYFEPLYTQSSVNYDELIDRSENKINNLEHDLNCRFSHLLSENEELRKEIKDLKKCLAYLNTRVNELLVEKQIKENE